ncbi:MAG TPA: WYL domain-containing protein [Cyclobacteriaceae bacterium]|jgi:predicted DNA-binding transcriptional regulator YafY
MDEIVKTLYQASQKRRVCRITMRGEPLSRVVHPYGICRTTKKQIVLVCWQSLGFTKAGGKEGYRNLLLENIEEVEVLEKRFNVQRDFNPGDPLYKEWVYHV